MSFSKLECAYLFSFLRKFGQRVSLGQTSMVKIPARLFEMLLNDKVEISNIMIVNDEVLEVKYNVKDEFLESPAHTNVVIAGFTTAHARLKLYSILEPLDKRVLYFDTVNINIYKEKSTSQGSIVLTTHSFFHRILSSSHQPLVRTIRH